MPRVLLVESETKSAHAIRPVLTQAGFHVALATCRAQALAQLTSDVPDLVLAHGLAWQPEHQQLADAALNRQPPIPFILLTHCGSEGVAAQDLQTGETTYIVRNRIDSEIVHFLRERLLIGSVGSSQRRLAQCLANATAEYELDNDPTLVPPLVARLEEELIDRRLCTASSLVRVSVALREALMNAIFHGNLELSSSLRDAGDAEEYYRLAAQRSTQYPYCDRRVFVSAAVSRTEAIYTVRDEGPGFDINSLPDPRDPAYLERASGRGILLIRTFMDEVTQNETGNALRMVKRCDK